MSGVEAIRKDVRAGRWRAARAALDRAVLREPREHRHYLLRSGVRLMCGDAAGGWSDLRRAFRLAPRFLAAYAEGRKGDSRPASLWSEDLIPTDSLLEALRGQKSEVRGRIRAWRGLLRRRSSDYAGAVADFDACGLRDRDVRAWRGEARLQLGDSGGFEDLERAARGSGVAWHHAWLGRSLVHFRRDRAALASFDRAVRLEPDNGWHLAWRGEAKRVLGVREGMLEDFDRALALDPGFEYQVWARTWKGLALLGLGRPAEALVELDLALETLPDYAFALQGRAEACRRLGRPADWLASLERAARLDAKQLAALYSRPRTELEDLRAAAGAGVRAAPRDAAARRWHGLFNALTGRGRPARAGLDRAVALAPRDAWGRAWRGQLSLQEGDVAAALRDLDAAAALAPDDALVLAWRARARLRAGDGAGALADLDRSLDSDGRFAWVYLERARLKLVNGDWAGGAGDLERALLLDRREAEAYADLAVARGKLGDAAGRRAALAKARALSAMRTERRLALWEKQDAAAGAASRPGRRRAAALPAR